MEMTRGEGARGCMWGRVQEGEGRRREWRWRFGGGGEGVQRKGCF